MRISKTEKQYCSSAKTEGKEKYIVVKVGEVERREDGGRKGWTCTHTHGVYTT